MSSDVPGRYAVVERIGAGRCFESYKVIDRSDGRAKLLHTADVECGQTAALTKMAARLPEWTRDDRVCIVLDSGCGKTRSMLWIISEYIAGALTLRELLAEALVGIEEALAIGSDIAAGLSHLEAHGIRYSSLTSSDVLVWHEPGRGIRAKVAGAWMPCLFGEPTNRRAAAEGAADRVGTPTGSTTAESFRRVWAEIIARTVRSVPNEFPANDLVRSLETAKASSIREMADLFVSLRRTNLRQRLFPVEPDMDADVDSVLTLDPVDLDQGYRARHAETSPARIIREIASRVFVQDPAALTTLLRSAMQANTVDETATPEQLSLLEIGGEDNPGPRLLLVDADEIRLARHSRALQLEGFVVRTVLSPTEAADLVDQDTFDAAAVWFCADDVTQDVAAREFLRYNTVLPVLSILPSTQEADVYRVLARLTKLEIHRRHRKRAKSAHLGDAELPFNALQRTSGI